MISYISGQVLDSGGGKTTILVNGLGYQVSTLARLVALPQEKLSLHTYLAVRENSLDLYGFAEEVELRFFELLITVPKIGPKSALQILDQTTIEVLYEAIINNDHEHLSKLSGVGKKTAERVVAGLQNKTAVLPPLDITVTPAWGQTFQDAFDTLITLGYEANSIKKLLDSSDTTLSTSDLVKEALKKL